MPRILIAEDQQSTSDNWKRLVTSFLALEERIPAGSIEIDQAYDYTSTVDSLDDYEYDLVLLDHHLDSENPTLTGFDVLTQLEEKNNGISPLSKRFVVLTGRADTSVARSYERFGCLEQLIKPISEPQFNVAMVRAWTKLRIGEEEEDWEVAYMQLSKLGLLQNLDSFQREVKLVGQLQAQVEGLKSSFDEFKKQFAGKEPEQKLAFYENTRKSLSNQQASVASILPYLKCYDVTEDFLRDVQQAFTHDRLAFWVLQSYLNRFIEKEGRVRHLNTGSVRHAEYRIGRSYRLYFREGEGRKVLERFDHKNNQPRVIDNLKNSRPPVVTNINAILR